MSMINLANLYSYPKKLALGFLTRYSQIRYSRNLVQAFLDNLWSPPLARAPKKVWNEGRQRLVIKPTNFFEFAAPSFRRSFLHFQMLPKKSPDC